MATDTAVEKPNAIDQWVAMTEEDRNALTPNQRACWGVEIAELMEAGIEFPESARLRPIDVTKMTPAEIRALPRSQWGRLDPVIRRWLRETSIKIREGFVYFVYAPDVNRLKIGFAEDVERRLATIQSMCPVKLVLVGTMKTERCVTEGDMHRMFKKHRLHGEWFACEGSLRKWLLDHPRLFNTGVLNG